jgi:dTDP-4-dehydrorhamnose 3,5-epimerase
MKILETELPGVLVLEPRTFSDDRGYFLETWHETRYSELGLSERFVQDNLSFSRRDVLRGLHFQHPNGQGKLVFAIQGEIFDVAVDIRVGSPTYGKWVGETLSGGTMRQIYIPPGFAHGFAVLSDSALVAYKCTEYYSPTHESSLRWDDQALGIKWPVANPIVSAKDQDAPRLAEISRDRLPRFEGTNDSG